MTISTPSTRRSLGGRLALFVVGLLALGGVAVGGLWAVDLASSDTERVSFTMTPASDSFTVETDNGEITITASTDNRVHVTRITDRGLRSPDFTEEPDGTGDRVAADCPLSVIGSACEVDYEVAVPAGLRLQLRTASGDIKVSGMTAGLTIDTSSGDVELRDVDGPLRVDNSSGSLNADGVRSDEVTVDSSSGGVQITFTDEPSNVSVNTSSGDVRLALPDGQAYQVDASSSSGDVRIGVDTSPEAPNKVRATSSSGNVEVVS